MKTELGSQKHWFLIVFYSICLASFFFAEVHRKILKPEFGHIYTKNVGNTKNFNF